MSTTWLITGASRGLGLEFTRQLSQDASNVIFATCRKPDSASDLKGLKEKSEHSNIHLIQLDQEDGDSIKKAATSVGGILDTLKKSKGLDYLLNNAAQQHAGNDKPSDLDSELFLKTMKNIVVGPVLVAQSFVPLMASSGRKVVMNMTSGLASIENDRGVGLTSYSVAKTALNMMTYKQSKEYTDFIFFVMDPGWVLTDMGGKNAQLKPEFSISHMLSTIKAATSSDSGSFKRYDGEKIPW